jgi:EmrB/QacA subfamily drug resistance transporter
MASTAYGATAAPATPFSVRSIAVPLIAIILGMFMVILDTTAVNVAVPTLAVDFKSDLRTLQWVLTGYMLAQAAVIPLAGWLSDRVGAKRLFMTSIFLFTVGSVLCSIAWNSDILIAFRVLQGLGGGFVMPVGMAYTYRLSPPDKRGVVMGTMGVPILFAPALGPTLSGWLVQYAEWRWIFLINLPVGILALILAFRRLPSVSRQAVPMLDLAGIILGPLSFALLLYGVSEGGTSWTSSTTLTGLIGGAIALVAFVAVELRARQPLLELRVFKSIDFTLSIIAQWVGMIALFGGIFLVPLFLQQVRGYGPFDTGLALMAQAGFAALFTPIGGRLFDKVGVRPLVVLGLASVAFGTFLLTRLTATTSGTDLIMPLAFRGAGMALVMMPLNTHMLNTAPRNLVGRVTALTSALQNVVVSLAIAALSTILTSQSSYHAASAAMLAAAPHGQGVAANAGPQAGNTLPPVIQGLFATAYNDTLLIVFIIAMGGALLGLTLQPILAPRAIAPSQAPAEHESMPMLEAIAG